MVIMSAKVSKRKIITGLVIAACVIALLAFLLHKSDAPAAVQESQTAAETDASTEEGRVAFLTSFGWEVSPQAVEKQEVKIPAEFNQVLTRYNELQKSQGYDLQQYAGKTVMRYVYAITNYPDGSDSHCATLLVYQGKVIGGDVSDMGGGKMHGFAMPS
ncbi:MAG TPA: DUF4830 domain-containing protein [Candidatus Avoscillospira stercoripullorum]|uniref:DUF4830 domain-containing protein n=1 Tax=Candidatus Avoscillospira stercoripullorum TaxID=2840709 RepID=A0A9D1A9Q6_9FIRM|nr:DUF4830 domain-containing protein [Candidatus Avoscillospira stercoripullorum]